MKRRESIVDHILRSNFNIIITVVILVMLLLFLAMCMFFRSSKISEANTQLVEVSHELKYEIDSALRQTDILVKNDSIIKNLDKEFSSNEELIQFTDAVTKFVSGLEETEVWEIDRVIMYSENPTLINSGYIRNSSLFENFEKIKSSMIIGMPYFRWNDTIDVDKKGRNYLTLYRYVPMKYDCIIELKLFTDSILPKDSKYNISLITSSDYKDDATLKFSKSVIESFVLTAEIEKKMLIRQYIKYFLAFLLFGFVFLLTTFFLAQRSVNKAMRDILDLIDKIEGGDILDDSKPIRWNELFIIRNKISDLTNKLNEITTKEYQHELLRRKLEIEILNSKINPHFLYNSLSAIKLIAFEEKCPRITDATDSLIGYYRLALNKGEAIISVLSELEYLEKYIRIHKLSKDVDYDIDYDCDEVLDIQIPHMLLQPLVENAIMHGLNNVPEARINICVYNEGKRLRIDVCDNGAGIDEDKLKKINDRKDLGYGLKSIIQRAEFYYGGEFDFHMNSTLGNGTVASLTIPKKIKDVI